MLQKVVLIGRCNVGKSTTFNKLIKKRIAITNKYHGTTVDSNELNVSWKNKQFIITDTAGYDPNIRDTLSIDILKQLYNTIQKADLLLFLVDGKFGIHTLDIQLAKKVRTYNKNIILIVNKIDTKQDEVKQYEFYNLGFNNIITISAEHNININRLLDKICDSINYQSDTNDKIEDINVTKIVLVGKSNVGKSSIINALANENKSITYNKFYTTRDSIKVSIIYQHHKYLVTDTAGISHNSKMDSSMQFLSLLSTNYAIEQGHIIILVVNALDGIGATEIKIARLLFNKKKPIIIVVNKWDLINNEHKFITTKLLLNQKLNKLKFIHWVDNILFVSAKTKYNLHKLLIKSKVLIEQCLKQIKQSELDQCVLNIIKTQICISKGKTLVIKNCIQVASLPPTFVFFVNNIELVHYSYKRFLENYLRKQFKLNCVPILCIFKKIS
ncbi:MAG: ribosome biogenesis GTPase Der [Endomicrobium sp.]|jgi:GTP-binding protein|nr:ribosome biogenesis GTPase Der [Endomicrobium sp.]